MIQEVLDEIDDYIEEAEERGDKEALEYLMRLHSWFMERFHPGH